MVNSYAKLSYIDMVEILMQCSIYNNDSRHMDMKSFKLYNMVDTYVNHRIVKLQWYRRGVNIVNRQVIQWTLSLVLNNSRWLSIKTNGYDK